MDAKVAARSRFYAIVAAAKIHIIQVHLQNLILVVLLFELIGKDGFIDLALHLLIVRQMAELDELLADGGGALHIGARLQIRPGCAKDADDIHTEMIVKPGVLRRNERIPYMGWDCFDVGPDAVFAGMQRGDLLPRRIIEDERALHIQNFVHVEIPPCIQLQHPCRCERGGRTKKQKKRKARAAKALCAPPPALLHLSGCILSSLSPHRGYCDRFVFK